MNNTLRGALRSLTLAVVGLLTAGASQAVNPILPLWEHIPDGEPYVFEDPDRPGHYRVYLYGSHDSSITEYCGRDQVVWSASVDSLSAWRYDGVIFECKHDANGNLLNAGGVGDVLYAPDVAVTTDKKGKKTYWLYPNNMEAGRGGMVARADRPDGPFTVANWDKENPRATVGVLGFDPAVFVDDDGRVYGYWGFERSYAAELDPSTMATVRKGTQIVEDLIPSHKSDDTFRFFEASSMRKIDDKYVLIYSRVTKNGDFGLPSTNYTLAYAYGDSPLGPFTYGGTIIDGRARGKDLNGNTIATATPHGNTHGSICQVGDQWWVFYHRQTGDDEYSRQAMVAPIDVVVEKGKGGKVSISEGEYTSEGFQTSGLPLYALYPAGIACHYTGPADAPQADSRSLYKGPMPFATRHCVDPKNAPSDLSLRSTPMTNCIDGAVLGYKYFDFSTAEGRDKIKMVLDIMPRGVSGSVAVIIGAPSVEEGGVEVGRLRLFASDPLSVQTRYIVLDGISKFTGKQAVYLSFSSDTRGVSLCDVYAIGFCK